MRKLLFILFVLLSSLLQAQPQDAQNIFMLGTAYEQKGDYAKAANLYKQLYEQYPIYSQFFESYNRMLLQQKEYNESIKVINDRITTQPNDITLYGTLGKTYYLAGKQNEALKSWIVGADEKGRDYTSFKIMANYATEVRDFDAAIEILKIGKKKYNNALYFGFDLGYLYSVRMKFSEAAKEYIEVIDFDPGQTQSVLGRVVALNRYPEAIPQIISELEKKEPEGNKSYCFLLAELYLSIGNYNDAFKMYLSLDKLENKGGTNLLSFGQKAMAVNNYSFAIKAYSYLIEKYPNTQVAATAKLGLAKGLEYQLNKQIDEKSATWQPIYIPFKPEEDSIETVIKAYEEVLKLTSYKDAVIEAKFRIGTLYAKMGEDKKALQQFQKLRDEHPISPFSLISGIETAKIFVSEDELTKAETVLTNIVNSNSPDKETVNEAKYRLLKLKFYLKRFEEVREDASKFLADINDNRANDALELTLLVSESLSDSVQLEKYCDADFAVEKGDYKKAVKILKSIAEEVQPSLTNQLANYKLALLQLCLGETNDAINRLNFIIKDKTGVYADDSAFILGEIYRLGLKDIAKAVESYEIIILNFPNSLYLDKAREIVLKLRS